MPATSRALLTYAISLLILGLAGSFINPHDKSIGWYAPAKTSIIACGTGAILAFILRTVVEKGGKAARNGSLAAAGFAFLFIAFSGYKVFAEGKRWSAGRPEDEHLWLKVFLFAAVLVVSIRAFITIVGEIRSKSAPGE